MTEYPRVGVPTMALALGVWLLAVPLPAAGQTVATTLSQLESRVSMGTTVVVETVDGRKVKGPVRRISEAGIAFDTLDAQLIPADAIRCVSSRTGHRPALKNVLVGMTLGAFVGVGYLIAEHEPEQPSCKPGEWFCGVQFGPSVGVVAAAVSVIGAGVGAGVGALLPPPMRVVYRASSPSPSPSPSRSPSRVTVAPFITPHRRGIALSIVF